MSRYHQLTASEAKIIEKGGTEPPGSGESHHREGIYLCRRCDLPLYLSKDKFDSGCGWPSFDDEIPGAIKRIPDGHRVEIRCARCDGHLGHVFEGEGFTAKNVRHCVNSLSMRFNPAFINGKERAIFGGGCFWGIQRDFSDFETVVGYTGGELVNPSYEEVCSGKSGHTEAIEILFDHKVTYESLIKRFYQVHSPGLQKCQYKSVIFYLTEEQRQIALKLKQGATEVLPASQFYRAEEYHQHYSLFNPD